MIPKLLKPSTSTMFFVNYFGTRASNPYDVFSTVPTLAERGGDFSAATTPSGAGVQIFDPVTHQPFANNQVPVSGVAKALFGYIPQANQPGDTQNFHFVNSADNNALGEHAVLVFAPVTGRPVRGRVLEDKLTAAAHRQLPKSSSASTEDPSLVTSRTPSGWEI